MSDGPGGSARAAVAVIALGANLGDRQKSLEEALAELARMPLTDLVRASRSMETVAITLKGPDAAAPRYLNAVALITTRLAPTVLLTHLHAIEARHGRQRQERWGDRTLDLDLVSYGDVVSDDPRVTLPHPRAAARDFVLEPWLELDPHAVLPGAGAAAELLARVREAS